MNNQNSIRILSITAVLLALACIFLPRPLEAQFAVNDRDYLLTAVPSQTGGDALYVTDTRTGRVIVFAWDPNQRTLVPKATGDLTQLIK